MGTKVREKIVSCLDKQLLITQNEMHGQQLWKNIGFPSYTVMHSITKYVPWISLDLILDILWLYLLLWGRYLKWFQHTSMYRDVTEEDQSAPEMSITKLMSHA